MFQISCNKSTKYEENRLELLVCPSEKCLERKGLKAGIQNIYFIKNRFNLFKCTFKIQNRIS